MKTLQSVSFGAAADELHSGKQKHLDFGDTVDKKSDSPLCEKSLYSFSPVRWRCLLPQSWWKTATEGDGGQNVGAEHLGRD